MRFDARHISLVTYFAILLFNIYTLVLYFNEQLTLYIHPRYILFTVFFNAVSLIACSIGFVLTAWRLESRTVVDRVHWRPTFTALVAGLVLLAAYSLPARTLSSDTAQQRSGNFNNAQVPTSESNAGNPLALFEVDTSEFDISDWASAFNMKASASFYEGKRVDVLGFVFHPEGTPKDVFYVSRFRITCCSVDAQPLGVPVYSPGWQEEFEEDAWVHVTGSFTETDQDIAEPAIIDPESIELTEQPDDPYVT